MKRLPILLTSAVLSCSSALAAGQRGEERTPAVSPPLFTWSGFYLGGQIGHTGMRAAQTTFSAKGPAVDAGMVKPAGLLGGVHGGYNWQVKSLVLGVEANIDISGVSKSATFANTVSVSETVRSAVVARAGFSVDRLLFYANGGVAFARGRTEIASPGAFLATNNSVTGVTSGAISQNGVDAIGLGQPGAWVNGQVVRAADNRLGSALGAGVEYAVSDRWSARIDYRRTTFWRSPISIITGVWGSTTVTRVNLTDDAVRLGVSYRY